MLRGELSTPVTLQGKIYRSGGGGSSVEPNPTGEIIGELETIGIDGEIYKIGDKKIETLLNEPNAVTIGTTYTFLNDRKLEDYDFIELIIATKENVSGNLGFDRWVMSTYELVNFPVINYGAYGQRWFYGTITNTTFTQHNASGDQWPYVYKIVGVKL